MNTEKYCTFCGAKLNKDEEICPECGKFKGDEKFADIIRTGAGGVGYSNDIDDERFAINRAKNKKIAFIFIVVFSLVITIILAVLGINIGVSLAFGIFMFILMFIIMLITQRKKKSFEGTVIKKSHYKEAGKNKRDHYKIVFETEDGKKKTQKYINQSSVYNYLTEGDRVRYIGEIGGMYAYEKYDKSRDDEILCVSCSFKQDARYNYCSVCGAKILKGNPTNFR